MAERNKSGGGQPQTLCPSPDLATEHSTDNTVLACGLSSAGRRHGWAQESALMTGKRPGANRRRLRNGDLGRTWTENQEKTDFPAWRTKLSGCPLRLAFL